MINNKAKIFNMNAEDLSNMVGKVKCFYNKYSDKVKKG